MGYNLVIEHKKFAWLDQPKRRENPFLTQELVKPYPKKIINHIDAREMSFIERGEFIMGSSAHLANEHPQRIVFLDEYYMDRFEVSNSQFHAYLKASQQLVRNIWPRGTPLEAEKDLAFGRASYYMAEAYCKWAGKDLPTEEQWEKAARGPGIKKEKDDLGRFVYYKEPFYYPWGNQYIPKNCNGEGRLNFILSVDSLPEGQSPYGIYHLMGNVMEWTKSWYKAYPQSSSRDRDFGEVFKVLRGGDYMSPRSDLRVSRRMPGGIPSLSEDRRAGIRCVYNLKTPAQDGP
jgi:formylglycine-generating enzyme required for sulfatase activity